MPDTLGAFVRNSGYLRKWLILGIAIGIIAGLGAVVFYLALKYTTDFLLGYLGGYDVPTAHGDGGNPGSPGFRTAVGDPADHHRSARCCRRRSSRGSPRKPRDTAPTTRSRRSTPIRAPSGPEWCW